MLSRRSIFGALAGLPFIGPALAQRSEDRALTKLGSAAGEATFVDDCLKTHTISAADISGGTIHAGKIRIGHYTRAVVGFQAEMHLSKDRTGLLTWTDALILRDVANWSPAARETDQVAIRGGSAMVTDDRVMNLVYDPDDQRVKLVPFMQVAGIFDAVVLATVARNFGVVTTFPGTPTIKA